MALTSLPDQKTPARPIEITFAAETGTPSANQEVLLIGHAAVGIPASGLYVVQSVNNSGDLVAASGECATKYGQGSELQKMVLAAIKANQDTGIYVSLKAVALASTDTDFGTADAALLAVEDVKAEFIVSPYDGQSTTNRDKLKVAAQVMSGPNRVHNNQFGTMGVLANQNVSDPSTLFKFDTQFLAGIWFPDASPTVSLGEVAAAAAAKIASNVAPFNPLDDVSISQLPAPALDTDWITVGFGLESEVCLNQGWTPLKVKPNGEVAFVRTVTGRISADGTGTPVVTAYYDIQDFQVLYYWRKTLYTRFSQPDFKQRKASAEAAREIKSEAIRLASLFEDQQMFQAVAQLGKQFQVVRSSSDRHRFDVKTPVNVIPGLHVIATNIEATTQYDELSI